MVQQLVNGLTLLQTRAGAVLPQDGSGVGQSAFEPLMTAQQSTVAQLQAFIKDLPEFLNIPPGGQSHIRQVDGDNALIEAAIVLVLAGLVVAGVGNVADAGVCEAIRRQEAAAAHAHINIALELQHLLLADVVRHHALGGAAGGQFCQIPVLGILPDVVFFQHIDQLWEGRSDPDALFVFHALQPLTQSFLNDEGQIVLLLLISRLIEVHEHGDEGSLAVGGQEGDDLILNGLHTPADLIQQALFGNVIDGLLACIEPGGDQLLPHDGAELFTAHLYKGGQMGQADGLAAILVAGHLCHDLGGNVAGGGKAVGLLDEGAGDDGTVLQHILQIHQVTVVHMLRIIIAVVEVDDAFPVGIYDVLGQQDALGKVTADLAGHIVPLGRVHHGILVGVLLLGLLVIALNEGEDLLVGGVGFTHQRAGVAVGDVVLGHLKGTVGHDVMLHHVLDLLHCGGAADLLALQFHRLCNALDLHGSHAVDLLHGVIGLGDGNDDLCDVKDRFRTVSFDDFHMYFLLSPIMRHNFHLV